MAANVGWRASGANGPLPSAGKLIGPVLALILVACASPSQTLVPNGELQAPLPASPKRITAAISGDAFTFYNKLNLGNGVGGIEDLEDMVTAGLANFDARERARPQLAETIPSIENGLWDVSPDGRMELTWRIRPGARWHDGEAFTAQDLVFSATVFQDPELPVFQDPVLARLESVEAPDPNTVVLRWRQPFIDADRVFTRHAGLPIPKHVLTSSYAGDKAGFMDQPYWAGEFLHAGPYRVREFVRGSHVVLEANDLYVLGRPRVDVIEVKFIPAHPTLMANILSGSVDLALGRGLSIGQASEVRDQWRDGRMEHGPSSMTRIYPEFDHPSPAVIANVQFRRALLHATDRRQLIEAFQFGLASLTDSILPDVPENQELNAGLARYDYDVRRAQQLVEGLGYARGVDWFFRDANGQRLTVEFRARGTDELTNLLAAIADYWARSGIASESVVVPPQRNQDREYRFNRPAFHMTGGTAGLDGIQKTFHSSQIPTPARGYVGSNDSHYANPEMDALIDRYLVTIPQQARTDVIRQILRLAVDDLPIMNVHFTVRPTLIHNRMVNVGAADPRSTNGWNAEQWDIR